MTSARSILSGENPRLGGTLAAVTFITSSFLILAAGIAGRWFPSTVGELSVVVTFVACPGAAGLFGGWRRLGVPAAFASGVAPPLAAAAVVPIGSALGIGTLGGGDLTTAAFAAMMGIPSLVTAIAGFGIGSVVSVSGRETDV